MVIHWCCIYIYIYIYYIYIYIYIYVKSEISLLNLVYEDKLNASVWTYTNKKSIADQLFVTMKKSEKTTNKKQQSMNSIYDISKLQVWLFAMFNCIIDVV